MYPFKRMKQDYGFLLSSGGLVTTSVFFRWNFKECDTRLLEKQQRQTLKSCEHQAHFCV